MSKMSRHDFQNLTEEETKYLNEIAESIKNDYVDFVDDFCKDNSGEELIWAAPFVSRNIYADSTFIKICYFELARKYFDRKDIIVCAYPDLGICLEKEGYTNVQYKRVKYRNIIHSFLFDVYGLYRYIKFIFKRKQLVKKVTIDNKKPIVIVATSIVEACFKDNKYVDYHFDRLFSSEVNCWIFPEFVGNSMEEELELERKAFKLCDRLIPVERYILVSDLLILLKYILLCSRCKNQKYIFNKADVSCIIQSSFERGRFSTIAYEGLLAGRAIENMKREGNNVRGAIVWYEGRPKDVMVASTIRKIYPQIKCIGYKGCLFNEFALSNYISQYQYQTAHAPSYMAVTVRGGEYDETQFCKDVQTLPLSMLTERKRISGKEYKKEEIAKVLVLLPYLVDASAELIKTIEYCVQNIDIDMQIRIKNHPVNKTKTLQYYGVVNPKFEYIIVDENVEELIPSSDVVITTASSAAINVINNGVKLVLLSMKGELRFTGIPMHGFSNMYELAYSKEDMLYKLENVLLSDYSESRNRFVDFYYDDYDGWLRILDS